MSLPGITGNKIPHIFVALGFMISVLQGAEITMKLPEKDVASAISNQFYTGGLELWDQVWLIVGQPNAYNRRDRAVIRLDLRPWLMQGSVKKFSLTWQYIPKGFQEWRELEISLLQQEEDAIDIYSGFVRPAVPFACWRVDGSKGKQSYRLDLTKEVNQKLSMGRGSMTIRIRDCYSDEFGNPGARVQMVGIIADSIRVNVEE